MASDVGSVYDNVLAELSRAGAKMARGWPEGVDPRAELKTYQYLLFSLVNSEVSKEEREKLRARAEKNPADVAAAAAVEPHGRWRHRNA